MRDATLPPSLCASFNMSYQQFGAGNDESLTSIYSLYIDWKRNHIPLPRAEAEILRRNFEELLRSRNPKKINTTVYSKDDAPGWYGWFSVDKLETQLSEDQGLVRNIGCGHSKSSCTATRHG